MTARTKSKITPKYKTGMIPSESDRRESFPQQYLPVACGKLIAWRLAFPCSAVFGRVGHAAERPESSKTGEAFWLSL